MAGPRKRDFQRRKPRREPKRRFYIFCEGKNTEPTYFAAVKVACAKALIEIKTYSGVGVPATIAAKATELSHSLGVSPKSRRRRNSFEEKDEVWAVFDKDDHPNFDNAVAQCSQAGVGVGRSNPCFEVWLILHEGEYDRPDGRSAVQAMLEKLRPEYDRHGAKTLDCTDLVSRLEEAEDRAKVQLARREEEGAPYGAPSTTVGNLTGAIRKAAKEAT